MVYVLIVIGIVAGLVLGIFGGLRAGAWARGNAVRYWSLNAGAFFGSLGLDILGLFVRQPWLSYGAIGLMAGLITGLKYGYSPTLRVWEPPPPPAEEPDHAEAPGVDEVRDSADEAAGDAPSHDEPRADVASGDESPRDGA
jgi:hypothetical protein